MSEREIKFTNPVPCPECGEGYLLAFLVPHFEGEDMPGFHKPFSHYEIIYRCSRSGCHCERYL
jgi:hypothetical protein